MHRFADAEAAYKEAAGIQRELAAQNPAAYRLDLARTLDNLGVLYDDTHRFADAEAAFKEAAGIERELAAQNPAAYLPDLAQTLNNLGVLYGDMHRFADAEATFKEAAGIRRELAAHNPAAYRPDLALTLNNLGALYRRHAPLRRRRGRLQGGRRHLSASWRRRTLPPTGPTWRRRSTTSLLCTGICTAIAMRKP